MRVAVMYPLSEVGVEDRPDPKILALPMRSSACPRPASAGRTCGLTGVSSRSIGRDRWATSTLGLSRRSAAR